jgi:RNA recognition motif-containing protein
LSNEITEEDIRQAMQKFGEILMVRIPMEDLGGGRYSKKKNKGFAFVTFRNPASADKALEQREITVEFATLEIERAMKRVQP